MRQLVIALVIAYLQYFGNGDSEVDEQFLLYSDIRPINRTESFQRIKSVPLVHYKFKYDSIPDRLQMGIIGPDAHMYFPESIDVVPSKTFSPKDKSKAPTVVTNFPVIDKTVLFMHGLVAIQELILRYEELNATIESMDDYGNKLKNELLVLHEQLQNDVDEHSKEQLGLARMEYELSQKQEDLDNIRAQKDAEQLEQQLAIQREMMEYEAQLARERMAREEELARKHAADALAKEIELTALKEEYSQQTAVALDSLRKDQGKELEGLKLLFEKEKIKAEMEAKSAQNKQQEEMELNKLKVQSRMDTERMIMGIKTVSNQISSIVQTVFAQPRQVAMIAGIVLVLIALYYFIRESMKLLRQFIQSRLGRPSLVRETSYNWHFLPNSIARLFERTEKLSAGRQWLQAVFDDVVLSADDKDRVLNLALATRTTKQSGAPFRHVLLHGPPGTGKTMIAKKLASSSGMDYAVMSGGDVGPLGEDAVNQLHGLFRWAERSRKGLLVFIDEAEAFLSARTAHVSNEGGSEVHVRNALNALLYQTGTPSRNFMLVLATNRPQDLDAAVLDRVDVSLPIGLPALPQRVGLVQLYLQLYLVAVAERTRKPSSWWEQITQLFGHRTQQCTIEEDCVGSSFVKHIAQKVDGFSGREIAKMFIAAQYSMYLAPDGVLTKSLLLRTVERKIEEHQMKNAGFSLTAVQAANESAVASQTKAPTDSEVSKAQPATEVTSRPSDGKSLNKKRSDK